jgi:transposase InsO family protein
MRCCITPIAAANTPANISNGCWPIIASLLDERSGNVWGNAAMESFFSLKTERTDRKIYRTREEAKADVFDYIERFYNAKRRHSTIGYMSPWSPSGRPD